MMPTPYLLSGAAITAGPPISRQTILVVEDEAAIAETIVYALRTEGFEPL